LVSLKNIELLLIILIIIGSDGRVRYDDERRRETQKISEGGGMKKDKRVGETR
jgi:hypothetical protein